MVPLDTLPDSLAEIMADPDAWTGDLAAGLTGKARSLKSMDLRGARELAEAAVTVASGSAAGGETTADALLAVGEVARASADWPSAQSAYSMAAALTGSLASNDPLRIKADLWQALLLRDLRVFGEAERLARSALRRSESISSPYWVRVALGVLGSVVGIAQPSNQLAAEAYRRALKVEAGPVMHRYALVGLAFALTLSGKGLEEAAEHLRQAESMDVPEDPSLDCHIWWTRGLLCSRQGRYIPGRAFLEDAARRLIEFDRPAYAGACLMDLAMLHLEHGRADRAAKLSADLWSLFGRLKVDREAFAAVKLYTEAAAAERLTVQMAGAIKRALELAAPNIPPLHAY